MEPFVTVVGLFIKLCIVHNSLGEMSIPLTPGDFSLLKILKCINETPSNVLNLGMRLTNLDFEK